MILETRTTGSSWQEQPYFFPNDGALFSAGDSYAAQGDGEACPTTIETALSGSFELTVWKDLSLCFSRVETPTHYMSLGMAPNLDDGAKQALREMI